MESEIIPTSEFSHTLGRVLPFAAFLAELLPVQLGCNASGRDPPSEACPLEVLLENSTVNPRGEVYRQREVMYLGNTFRKRGDIRKVYIPEVSNHAV